MHYSLQGNHAHLIVEAKDRFALGRSMKAIGSRLARALNRVFGRKGPVLADRYPMRVLRTPREVRNALAYVLLHSRRHAAKDAKRLSKAVRLDPASSGRWFDGWRSRPKETEQASMLPVPVGSARTWLLAHGWRRQGLLDPSG